jgi:hypothetical protein
MKNNKIKACFCDVEDGDEPLQCVLDNDQCDIDDCYMVSSLFNSGSNKDLCPHWQPLKLEAMQSEDELFKTKLSKVNYVITKEIATKFYYWWHNQPGTNTEDGFDKWWKQWQG